MKKLALLLLLLLIFPLHSPAFSQEDKKDTTTPTTTPETTDDKIEELKEKVAERVAELKKGKADGLFGVVKSATEEAFILVVGEDEYSIQLDEDTKVYSIDTKLRKKEVKLSTFKKDTNVSMIGTVNTDEKTAIATVVVSRTPNTTIIGTVSEVSTKDGTITVDDFNENTYTINIEVSTDTNTFNAEENEQTTIGLSKIETGSYIIVYGVENDDDTISASRVLILPQGFENATIESPTPTPTPAPKKPQEEE